MRRSKLQDLRVRDVMSKDLVTLEPDDTVGEALGKMKKHGVHELPVVHGKNVAGLVTMSAIMRRRGLPPSTSVATLLQTAPAVTPEDDLPTAAEKMIQGGFRAFPVMERKRLVGIVSRTDLTKAIASLDEFADVKVRDVMTPSPQTVSEDDSVEHAIRTMQGLGERSLPVLDRNRRLIGVVGMRDLQDSFAQPREGTRSGEMSGEKTRSAVELKGAMRYPVVTVGPDATVAQSARLMVKHDISSVIVVDRGEPIGILTKLDLAELLAGLQEREELLVQISGLEEQSEVYDALYEVIRKSMKKLAHIVTPRTLTVHVQTYKGDGDRQKHSLHARFTTAHRMYYVNHFDWDLLEAMAGLMDIIEKQVLKEKERLVAARRRRTRS